MTRFHRTLKGMVYLNPPGGEGKGWGIVSFHKGDRHRKQSFGPSYFRPSYGEPCETGTKKPSLGVRRKEKTGLRPTFKARRGPPPRGTFPTLQEKGGTRGRKKKQHMRVGKKGDGNNFQCHARRVRKRPFMREEKGSTKKGTSPNGRLRTGRNHHPKSWLQEAKRPTPPQNGLLKASWVNP